ncbi:hypothetical protein M0812_14507 [Anaeramoeba flamelloides]|uniref:Uncharacterized protein n=1 Tax=Anaeramoeba flamelloides TaxID=1746091 RepID=A0AAV7ZFZ1_9EUKA|nr:hypothetical protein M0812_14507 [Anaeramoeba flamelloides]
MTNRNNQKQTLNYFTIVKENKKLTNYLPFYVGALKRRIVNLKNEGVEKNKKMIKLLESISEDLINIKKNNKTKKQQNNRLKIKYDLTTRILNIFSSNVSNRSDEETFQVLFSLFEEEETDKSLILALLDILLAKENIGNITRCDHLHVHIRHFNKSCQDKQRKEEKMEILYKITWKCERVVSKLKNSEIVLNSNGNNIELEILGQTITKWEKLLSDLQKNYIFPDCLKKKYSLVGFSRNCLFKLLKNFEHFENSKEMLIRLEEWNIYELKKCEEIAGTCGLDKDVKSLHKHYCECKEHFFDKIQKSLPIEERLLLWNTRYVGKLKKYFIYPREALKQSKNIDQILGSESEKQIEIIKLKQINKSIQNEIQQLNNFSLQTEIDNLDRQIQSIKNELNLEN